MPPQSLVRSRKYFTQHQLFAILSLKTFLKVDYWGIAVVLKAFAELREDLTHKTEPRYSTLGKAEDWLLKKEALSTSSTVPSYPPSGPN